MVAHFLRKLRVPRFVQLDVGHLFVRNTIGGYPSPSLLTELLHQFGATNYTIEFVAASSHVCVIITLYLPPQTKKRKAQ